MAGELDTLKEALVTESSFGHDKVEVDEVGRFWVVTRPSKHSGLRDIMFETNVHGMLLQTLGGLKAMDLLGVFKNQAKAKKFAEGILAKRDAGEIELMKF